MNIEISGSIQRLPDNMAASIATLARLSVVGKELEGGSPFLQRVKKKAYLASLEKLSEKSLELFSNYFSRDRIEKLSQDRSVAERASDDVEFSPEIFSCYLQAIGEDKPMTIEVKDQLIALMKKDLATLVVKPVVEASLGLEGPTFLVDYLGEGKTEGVKLRNVYVIKWTNWNEYSSSLLYKSFSSYFDDPKRWLGFQVPASTFVDLSSGSSAEGSDQMMCANLKKIGALSKKKPVGEQVKVEERIYAEDFFEFATTKYRDDRFTDQHKELLFQRIARISFLDLIMGNMDRFLRLSLDAVSVDTLLENPFEANLSNIFIAWKKNSAQGDEIGKAGGRLEGNRCFSPHSAEAEGVDREQTFVDSEKSLARKELKIFAIDNTIDSKLIDSDEKKKLYLIFLKEIVSSKTKMLLKLKNLIITAIRQGMTCHLEEMDNLTAEKINALRERSSTILEDLQKEAIHNAVYEGLFQMHDELEKVLIPLWKSDIAIDLKRKVEEVAPELLASVGERLALFTHCKTDSSLCK